MWWGIALHVYINTQIICSSKSLDLFALQINQLIHQATWVDSVCSFMRIPFSIDPPASRREPSLSRGIPKKKLHDSNTNSFFPRKLFASRNQTDWPPYIASALNMKTEQASFLIGWTAVAMETEEEFASLAYLKTAAPSVDKLYYHKYFIRSVLVALSVTNVEIRKTSSVLWAWTFSYNSWNPEWILLLFC